MSASHVAAPAHTRRTRELLGLAWPAVLSYILNNAYRINDQFWIQGLGAEAQAAVGATFFLQVLNFAFVFLAVGGTLALVSRAVGARDPERRDAVVRSALGFGLAMGIVLTLCVLPLLDRIVLWMGLAGETAVLAEEYLGALYLFMTALALLPVVDSVFIGRGNTRVPMALQACAVVLNYFLNPLLIYGRDAAERMDAPGVEAIAALASALDLDGMGLAGAAVATGLARTIVVLVGIWILGGPMESRLIAAGKFSLERAWRVVRDILRISFPSSASIGIYALAYLLLLRLVLTPLGDAVTAGLGVGFQVFEGISFPCYLGISIAGSSLIGRELGARNRAGVLEVVGCTRFWSRTAGLVFAALFWFGGPYLVNAFTQDPAVARETVVYVRVLAFSQYWVAVESANEKVLLGSGRTGPIMWISPLGNLLRIPLGWWLAFGWPALGAAGVWWAINATTCLKAGLFWDRVRRGNWLEEAWEEGG